MTERWDRPISTRQGKPSANTHVIGSFSNHPIRKFLFFPPLEVE